MPKIEPFEKYSDRYDEWFEKNIVLYQAELEAVRRLVPPPPAEGMEVGVGSGKFAAPLGIEIGVEPSEKMASRAKRLSIDVYPGVAEKLPFAYGRFDFVLMVTTICFVDDIIKSFGEVFLVLKDNGFIIVGFVDKESELGIRYIAKKDSSRFYKYANFYSTTEVLEYLRKVGFAATKILQTLIPGELPETILEGFGRGSFVVIKAVKNRTG
jgi:SAM-dependent methyltransferase